MESKKHHIVIIPCPAQGHINPMLKLAKLLHSRGFSITFVHTEFIYGKLATLMGSNHSFLQGGLDNFRFETIPDGLPGDNKRGVHDIAELTLSFPREPKTAFRALLSRLLASNDVGVPYVISDAHMNFTYEVGNELGIKVLLFYTPSACAALGFLHFDQLITRGLFPLKDENCFTNGYLDTPVDWIPGLFKGAKLKHLPSFLRTTNPQETMFHFNIETARVVALSGSIIFNTFDDLEGGVMEGIKTKVPNICTIGPLSVLFQQANLQSFGLSLWKEDTNCLEWLDKRSPKSVLYVNYGSLTTLTSVELHEFAWGLANSKQQFLWVLRNDMVIGESGTLSKEFMEEIKERGLISGWIDQERVLKHPSIGVFLTHCGWNSFMESICEGIPMICWPYFADQQTNCFYACDDWGIGVEIEEGDVKREKVEKVVREMMEGEKGKEMRVKAMEWKKKAEDAVRIGGSSYNNFENLVKLLID